MERVGERGRAVSSNYGGPFTASGNKLKSMFGAGWDSLRCRSGVFTD